MIKLTKAACAIAVASVSVTAQAATINLDRFFTVVPGSPSVYVIENDFALPTGFSNALLTITNLEIDDRGIVLLNGGIVDNAGIFGPGAGSLVLTPGGSNDPFTFTRGNGARNVAIATGFVAGLNSFRIVVNDTNAGIGGSPLPGGVNLSGGGILATISFDQAAAVPEPASWAMMIGGFALAGAAARRRSRPVRLSVEGAAA